jgi:hypothetical protein
MGEKRGWELTLCLGMYIYGAWTLDNLTAELTLPLFIIYTLDQLYIDEQKVHVVHLQ